MLKNQKKYLLFSCVFTEFVLSLVIFCFCSLLFFVFGANATSMPVFEAYAHLLPLLLIFPVAANLSNLLGDNGNDSSEKAMFIRAGAGIFMAAGLMSLLLGVWRGLPGEICFGVLAAALAFVAHVAARRYHALLLRNDGGRSIGVGYALIIGTGPLAETVARYLRDHPEWGMRVVGFIAPDKGGVGGSLAGFPILGAIDDFQSILLHKIVDCVIFCGGVDYASRIDFIIRRCQVEGVDFSYAFRESEQVTAERSAVRLGDVWLREIRFAQGDAETLFAKRLFDLCSAGIILFASLPVFIVVSLLIRLNSRGPILFRQERVGKNGRLFHMFKFRSMVENAEALQANLMHLNEMDGPVFKIENDPRLTRIGKVIRRTSLDEFPQLFNVLVGEMSMVGPRPPIFREVEKYSPWEKKRLSSVQGITCVWQVSGRNNIKFDEWMKLDVMYIESWSLALDFKILLKTIPAVLFKIGAR